MSRIFNKIRQNLLAQNRFTRYLVYAIGEIVLVVIGILIALQVNYFSERQKQSKLEQNYYCRLLDDAAADKEQINYLLALAQDRLKASNQAVRLLIGDDVSKREIGNQVSLAIKAVYSDFQPNNSAYEDLKSGANLNIISDKSIIKALNHYFNRVEELKSIIMVNGEHAVDISFAHADNFSNGSYQSSLEEGRLSIGLDQDLKDAIDWGQQDNLSTQMKARLLNESLEYVSVNARQVELYGYMLTEINALEERLKLNCNASNR